MDQYSTQSARKEYLPAELSSFSSATDDGTKKILDSLGKFKTSQTVSQIKVRPYRSNASDNESPGPPPSLSRAKQEAKSRETSSGRRTSDSQKNDAAKTVQSQNSRSATSARHSDDRSASDGNSSTYKPSNLKDNVSSLDSRWDLRTLKIPDLLTVKIPKKELKKFEMRETLKDEHQVDSSSKNQRNREESSSAVETEPVEHKFSAYKRDQAELQKRIEELKREIYDQKSKIIETSSHMNEVALKSARDREYISASSSSQRAATEVALKSERDREYISASSSSQRAATEVALKSERDREYISASSSSQRAATEVALKSERDREYISASSSSQRAATEVTVKSERDREYISASSSSQRAATTEASKRERKDDGASRKSVDYRQKASEEKSRINEMVVDAGNVAVKSERSRESFRASSSSHGTGTETSKHLYKDERVSHKSDDYYRQKSSQDPQKSASASTGRQQRQDNDKSRRSRSLEQRTEGGEKNIRSRGELSHSRTYTTTRSRSRNREQSPQSRSHRSRSAEKRSRRSRSPSSRSRRSGSHDRRTSSKSNSVRDGASKDKAHVKQEEVTTRESSNLPSRHDQRHSSPVVGKKQRSRSRSPHSPPHNKGHHRSVDEFADDNRNAMNKYLSSRHSPPKMAHSESRDSPKGLSRSRRSPSSVCSFELDWPRSPCQPGMNQRARVDCVSPMSQLYASGEARMYQDIGVLVRRKTEDKDGGKFAKDWLSSGIMGPRLLVKRDAQRNSVISIWAERTIDCFEVIRTIGRGTYGQVYKAADKDKNLLVAVKRIVASSKHGFPLSAVREMTCLHLLDHPNIIRLLEIIRDTKGKESTEIMGMYYYVYEYVAHDLKGIIESKLVKLSSDDISGIMIQLLNAVDYCHSHNLVHRNIKSSNILINYRGELKLTQFGMSRILHNSSQKDRPYTTTVTNLWYRSPELLLGSDLYETTVDLWGCGCVMGEMFLQKPLFPGRDDLHQLHLISILCGSPSTDTWLDVTLLPLFYTIKSRAHHPRRLREEFSFLPVAALDMLDLLLTLDPKKRSTAAEALRMDWLRDINLNKLPPIHLPKTVDCHSLSEEESKSESRIEPAPIEVKRPLSPDTSQQDDRAMKRRELGLALREAVDALQQRPPPMDVRSPVPTPEPSAVERSTPEMPAAPSKPKLLNLVVKDYQHQTVSPPSKAGYLQQKKTDLEMQGLPHQRRHAEDRLTYNPTDETATKVTDFPGSDFAADPGLRYREHTAGRPGLQPAAEKNVPAASAAVTASASILSSSSSSDRVDPVLPESSVAFWNAMKVYCANFSGSQPGGSAAAAAAAAENQAASKKPLQPRTSSLYRPPTETGYQEIYPEETMNPIKQPSVYSGHPYGDTMYGERTQHRPGEFDPDSSNSRNNIPRGTFPYEKHDVGVSGVRRPRLPAPPSRKEATFGHTDTMPTPHHSLDVDSRLHGYARPCFPSVVSTADAKVESSTSAATSTPLTRIQYIAPRPAEKLVPYKETPPSAQSLRTDGAKPVVPPSTSGSHFSAASGDGPSTLPVAAAAGPAPTNVRPKLMGILKNRIEVKTDANVEWKTLQPKQ